MIRTIRRYFAMRAYEKAARAHHAAIGDFSIPLEIALMRANMAKQDMNRAASILWSLTRHD